MKSTHLAIAAVAASFAVAGCHNSDPTKKATTTVTTSTGTPAPAATDAMAAPATDAMATPAPTSDAAGGDLHNSDPTASKSMAPAKP